MGTCENSLCFGWRDACTVQRVRLEHTHARAHTMMSPAEQRGFFLYLKSTTLAGDENRASKRESLLCTEIHKCDLCQHYIIAQLE